MAAATTDTLQVMPRRTAPILLLMMLAASLVAAIPGWAVAGPITHTLTVTKAGNGGGTVTSDLPGIACGDTCSSDFVSGVPVTLDRHPQRGLHLHGLER